jgi:prefoldin beta subunit
MEQQQTIEQLQSTEQQLQGFMMQKQQMQLELNETNTALEELKTAEGDVYKTLGNVMLKTDKPALEKELEEKKKLADLRLSSIEKQEALLTEKATKLRDELQKAMEKTAKKKEESQPRN